jgi:hypothetical protein
MYGIAKVLTAKHTASLQLLCTVSGNQARLAARTEFKNLERSPKGVKLVVHITVPRTMRRSHGNRNFANYLRAPDRKMLATQATPREDEQATSTEKPQILKRSMGLTNL